MDKDTKSSKEQKMNELKELNSDYTKNTNMKMKLQKLKGNIENLSNDIELSKLNINQYEVDKQKAIFNKDKVKEEEAQKKIDAEKQKIKEINKKLLKMKTALVENENRIDSCIEKVSQNPEFKKVVDAAISKKLVRRTEKALKQNQDLKTLKDLINNHPQFKNSIVGMKNATSKMKILNDELAKLDSTKDAAKIASITAEIKANKDKYAKNEKSIMDFTTKNNINISENFLKDFVSSNFKMNKGTGEYNIDATINNKIKGNEKSIKDSELALSKLDGRNIKAVLNDNNNMEIEASNNLPAVQTKTKWFNFITRFKNWRENRKIAKANKEMPEVYTDRKDYEEDMEKKNEKHNEFSSIYKYEVVQKYAEMREKELYQGSKKQNKKQQENGQER